MSRTDLLDVLFVIDDTSAIAPYREKLARGMIDMATELGPSADGDAPSLHVGFVGTSAHPEDASTRAIECGVSSPLQYLRFETCGQVRNFEGSLEDAFSCLSALGDSASEPPHALTAIQQTLRLESLGWAGFLRPAAKLAIVVIAAEDDASATPEGGDGVSATVDFLRSLKTDPDQVTVGAIGPSDRCPSTGDVATFPPRLKELVDTSGPLGTYYPICADDYATVLVPLLTHIHIRPPPLCFERVRDVDLETPGLQPQCAVADTVSLPDGSSTTAVLGRCDESPPPCWSLLPGSPGRCSDKLIVSIKRGVDYCPDNPASTRFACLGCRDPNDPACAEP